MGIETASNALNSVNCSVACTLSVMKVRQVIFSYGMVDVIIGLMHALGRHGVSKHAQRRTRLLIAIRLSAGCLILSIGVFLSDAGAAVMDVMGALFLVVIFNSIQGLCLFFPAFDPHHDSVE